MQNDTTTDDRDTLTDALKPYDEREVFDRAMRELEVLERTERADDAAKRGLETLRQCGSLRAFCRVFAAAGALMATVTLGSVALGQDAPAKPKRPVLCMSGAPVSGNGLVYFVCTDGKRPRILLPYIEVQFAAADGKEASYVLGWPATQTKPIPLPRKLPKDERPTKPTKPPAGIVKL